MLKVFCCFALLISISLNSKANSIDNTSPKSVEPFSAQYSILRKSDPIGKATRQLHYLDDGTVQYSYSSKIKWFIYSDERIETSTVEINNNKVIPQHYVYTRESTTRDRAYEWRYDASNNKATDIKKNKTQSIDFSTGLQDPLSYHLQHRLNLIEANQSGNLNTSFSYPVIKTSGSTKSYAYQYDGTEELMLPYGLIKTVKFKREVPEKKRVTYAWFAPELDFLLVKLYQAKGGNEQFEVQLTAYDATDKAKNTNK